MDGPGLLSELTCAGRKLALVGACEIVHREAELLHVVDRLGACGGLAHLGDGGHQEPDQEQQQAEPHDQLDRRDRKSAESAGHHGIVLSARSDSGRVWMGSLKLRRGGGRVNEKRILLGDAASDRWPLGLVILRMAPEAYAMIYRRLLAFFIASSVLSTLPGCCCCMPGFRGPKPQPFPQQPAPQPVVPQPQDGFVVGPGADKKDDIKPADGNQPVDKTDRTGKKGKKPLPLDLLPPKDNKDGPPPPVDLEDVSTGGLLTADPLPKPLVPVSDPKGSVALPLEGKGINNLPVRYPWAASPVVALTSGGGKKGGMAAWQVWDMQAMKKLGEVPGQSGATVIVSPDGAYLAIEVFKGATVKPFGVQIGR